MMANSVMPQGSGTDGVVPAAAAVDTRMFSQMRPTASPFAAPHIHQSDEDWRSLLSFASQMPPANQLLLFGLPHAGPTASSTAALPGGIGQGCSGAELSRCPLLVPPERDALASLVTPEEVDIYRMSDSEDEAIEVPRRVNSRFPVATGRAFHCPYLSSILQRNRGEQIMRVRVCVITELF